MLVCFDESDVPGALPTTVAQRLWSSDGLGSLPSGTGHRLVSVPPRQGDVENIREAADTESNRRAFSRVTCAYVAA